MEFRKKKVSRYIAEGSAHGTRRLLLLARCVILCADAEPWREVAPVVLITSADDAGHLPTRHQCYMSACAFIYLFVRRCGARLAGFIGLGGDFFCSWVGLCQGIIRLSKVYVYGESIKVTQAFFIACFMM